MSMAVIDGAPESETDAALETEPTFVESLSKHASLRIRQLVRFLWRPVVIVVRSLFWLEEDSQRDQMLMENRADLELLAGRLGQSLSAVNLLNERLSAHEDAVPRMRAIRTQFDNTKRIEREERERAIQKAVAEEQDAAERLSVGVLT
jgi:hypothetical protein